MIARIEADVFSGISNPSWSLSHREEEELREMIEDVVTSGSHEGVWGPPDLGYRGFVLRVEGEDSLEVWNGMLRRQGIVYGAAAALERWLIERASGKLDARIFQLIEAEVIDTQRGGK